MEKIKYAIFDVDGTLTDSMHIWDTCGGAFLMSCGISVEGDEGFGSIDYRRDIPEMIKKYGLPLTYDEVTEQLMKILEYYYFNIAQAKPGAEAFLRRLQENGVKTCIITATDRYLIEGLLERLGIRKYFGCIFSTVDLEMHKDRPEIFNMARDFLKAGDSSEVFVFEDALYSMKTAKAAGYRVVAVEDYSSAGDRGEIRKTADYYVTAYDEAYGIFDLK